MVAGNRGMTSNVVLRGRDGTNDDDEHEMGGKRREKEEIQISRCITRAIASSLGGNRNILSKWIMWNVFLYVRL